MKNSGALESRRFEWNFFRKNILENLIHLLRLEFMFLNMISILKQATSVQLYTARVLPKASGVKMRT